jgi:hypothetical protein
MLQVVKAKDKFASSLFQWDTDKQVISISHGKEIWYIQLESNGTFTVLGSKPKTRKTVAR